MSIDVIPLLRHAIAFNEAAHALRERAPNQNGDLTKVLPLLVLEVFTIELLLKVLIVIDGGKPQKSHELDKLFESLGARAKREVISRWDRGPRKVRGTAFASLGLPTELPLALQVCSRAFQELRYGYEDYGRMKFYLGDLPAVLISVIDDLRPGLIAWRDGEEG